MDAQCRRVPKTLSEVIYPPHSAPLIPEPHSGAQLRGHVVKYPREKGEMMQEISS